MRGLTGWWQARVLERERARVDPHDWARVRDALPLLDDLTEEEARRLADLALLFLRDKRLDPAQGLELTDAMRLAIALQACLPSWRWGWIGTAAGMPSSSIPRSSSPSAR
jgi:MtfA peptidase